ncbi:MAG: site-specific integrase [Clostridia bacterium]|nr:site-specific integrase [Clostridia bacterium]
MVAFYAQLKRRRKTVLKAATDSITLYKVKELTATVGNMEQTKTTESMNYSEILIFPEQEILKMPRKFRKDFRCQGITAHVHRRRSGKKNWNYEIRCQINKLKVNVSSNNLDVAKQKFIKRVHEVEVYGDLKAPSVPSTFDGFSEYYFENFYKRKVTSETLRVGLNQYKNHLHPHFGNIPIKRITPKICQDLLDRLDEQGKGKTADDVHSLLNMIFKAAVKHNIIHSNPLDMVFHTKHEQQHGSALSKEEEKLLLSATAGTPQHLMFAMALYTGMRPNEYETAKLDGNFIVAINSKRKNGKVEYKKIPITPMLKPYLGGVDEIQFSSLRIMRDRFNKIFPKHKLYDLRTTFYTRCQECGVADVARNEFVGHSLGALCIKKVYFSPQM